MAAEGLDIPSLNTLLFASPISDIEQSIGRILRSKPEDRIITPLVIDIVDDFSIFTTRFNKRLTFYKKKNYQIKLQ
jgi:superfamily II DNA or RNA helicase